MQNYALACDAMVFPYSDVLTSGSVMTAFTFGRPAIVPDRGSMREAVLPELGIVYDPDEPEALLKAMTTVRTVRYEGPAIQAYAKSQAWENSASLLIERLSKPIKDGR